MYFGKDEIIILLGAGCSAEAKIPTSIQMIERIEQYVENSWKEYKELYNYLKSSIYYADGVGGKFNQEVNFNIERLVNVLNELEKKEEHTMYPFIGNWNIKLIELAGFDFKKISDFKNKIMDNLKKWVTKDDYADASYYSKFIDFQKQYQFHIRIFTLNYDLCLERNVVSAKIERGFGENRKWDWKLFEFNPVTPVDIFLYKMHGSIDWRRDGGELTFSDDTSRVENPDLIFGTNYKLQYIDPYLFSAYEFRKYSLEAKLITTIGYGFGDEHINSILAQALKNNSQRKLLCVGLNINEEKLKKALLLENSEQFSVKEKKAKDYLENDLKIEELKNLFLQDTGSTVFGE